MSENPQNQQTAGPDTHDLQITEQVENNTKAVKRIKDERQST